MTGLPVFDARHSVIAKRILDDITIDSNLDLLGVHQGKEVVNGAGKIQLNKLEINVNGKRF
jgi:hypothetical protein